MKRRSVWMFLVLLAGPVIAERFDPGDGPVARIMLHPSPSPPAGTPQLLDEVLRPFSARLVVPLDETLPVDAARQRVLRLSGSAAAWAALASAHYREGRYEAAWSAARQMGRAAVQLDLPLSLSASRMYEKCRRAAEALALVE